jgi:hypothetical protein
MSRTWNTLRFVVTFILLSGLFGIASPEVAKTQTIPMPELIEPFFVSLNNDQEYTYTFSLNHDAPLNISWTADCTQDRASFQGQQWFQSLPLGRDIFLYEGSLSNYEARVNGYNQYLGRAGTNSLVFSTYSGCDLEVVYYDTSPPDGENGTSLTIGSVVEDRLNAGTVNLHSLIVENAPRTISLSVRPNSGTNLKPVVRIYSPSGRLAFVGIYDQQTSETRLSQIELVESGEYEVTVQDWNHETGGAYQITVVDAPPLSININEVRTAYLPYYGQQNWSVNVEPRDLVSTLECIVYSLTPNQPKPVLPYTNQHRDYQDRRSLSREPGIQTMTVFNDSTRGTGEYVFGCTNIGTHRTVGIGGEFDWQGDYFTRFVPAIEGHSAQFTVNTSNGRQSEIQLWFNDELLASNIDNNPIMEVVFPESGIYTFVGQGAPGTSPWVGDQHIAILWGSGQRDDISQPIAPVSGQDNQQSQRTDVDLPPRPEVVCPGSLPSQLFVGEMARVTPGEPNNLRDRASTSGGRVGQIPGSRIFLVLDGPVCSDEYAWWQVYYEGTVGWTAEGNAEEYWLEPIGLWGAYPDLVIDMDASYDRFFVAHQEFEHGHMFWLQPTGQIWVLTETASGRGNWTIYPDTFREGEAEEDSSLAPPGGLYQPRRGFGKVWRDDPNLRSVLGWALAPEQGFTMEYEYHPLGEYHVLYPLNNQALRVNEDGTWTLNN